MPCRSDHMEPNAREVESKLVAEHIVYFFTEIDIADKIPEDVAKAAKEYYGDPDKCDLFTALLCNAIEQCPVHEGHAVIYNGRKKKSRALADWWENHKEVDRKREEEEAQELADQTEREEVLNSLTDYQRAVLFPND